jgi:hypothetical protein
MKCGQITKSKKKGDKFLTSQHNGYYIIAKQTIEITRNNVVFKLMTYYYFTLNSK